MKHTTTTAALTTLLAATLTLTSCHTTEGNSANEDKDPTPRNKHVISEQLLTDNETPTTDNVDALYKKWVQLVASNHNIQDNNSDIGAIDNAYAEPAGFMSSIDELYNHVPEAMESYPAWQKHVRANMGKTKDGEDDLLNIGGFLGYKEVASVDKNTDPDSDAINPWIATLVFGQVSDVDMDADSPDDMFQAQSCTRHYKISTLDSERKDDKSLYMRLDGYTEGNGSGDMPECGKDGIMQMP